jgi:hypothetical protein
MNLQLFKLLAMRWPERTAQEPVGFEDRVKG